MKRTDILAEASRIISVDRQATHGDPENSFGLIAAYWSSHLDHPVNATDVAAMMALFKLARIKGNPGHVDSWTDGIGYLAIGGELATEGRE